MTLLWSFLWQRRDNTCEISHRQAFINDIPALYVAKDAPKMQLIQTAINSTRSKTMKPAVAGFIK